MDHSLDLYKRNPTGQTCWSTQHAVTYVHVGMFGILIYQKYRY